MASSTQVQLTYCHQSKKDNIVIDRRAKKRIIRALLRQASLGFVLDDYSDAKHQVNCQRYLRLRWRVQVAKC